MAKSKTLHVIPQDGNWAVKREGARGTVHSTKGRAVESARTILRNAASGQIVIHNLDGRITEHITRGMPKIQHPPKKSRLGTKKIEQAVNKVLFDRLGNDAHPPRD